MAASFKQFNLSTQMIQALDKIHFTQPTLVQEKLLPAVLSGRDVIGQSQTGSGKTHVFLIPILEKIDSEKSQVQAVVTAPSRELAMQLREAFESLIAAFNPDIHVGFYVGGTDKKRQIEKLGHHQPQIVIGTPGRILDLVKSNDLQIQHTAIFVIDEADMTLDMGFLNDVDAIASQMPKDLQMLVFSATIPQKLTPFLRKYMSNPMFTPIKSKTLIPTTIKNLLFFTKGKDKKPILKDLITLGEPYLVLIFANTKEKVDELHDYLENQGLKVAKVHGDIQPRQRKRTMKEIEELKYQYVVATDLAARGIDIKGVSEVVNYELPTDPEFFIHRVGRTGRNGLQGTALTLYGPDDEAEIQALENMGVHFKPVRLQNGELTPAPRRDQRQRRRPHQENLDTHLRGFVKKEKRTKKPGYKRKIKEAIAKDAAQKRKIERRRQQRHAKG